MAKITKNMPLICPEIKPNRPLRRLIYNPSQPCFTGGGCTDYFCFAPLSAITAMSGIVVGFFLRLVGY